MKTILVLNWRDLKHPEAGGAEVHFQEIFRRLVRKDYRVILLTTRFRGCTDQDTQDGITVLRWGATYFFNWQAPFLIRRALKRYPIDFIVDDVNKLPFFSPCFFRKIPCAAFFHHLFGRTIFELAWYPMALYILLFEKLCSLGYRSTPICTVSQSTVDDLVNHGFNRGQITVIENSVDTDLYTPGPADIRKPDLLFYAGRLKRYKNVDIIMDAMKILDDWHHSVHLAIAGTGDDESTLSTHAAKLGLTDRVTFLGYIDEMKKIEWYRSATIFVMPSLKEGWGITCIEASACGCAVIANDAPGLCDSVRDKVTGFLYKNNDAHSLADCINQLIADPARRQSMEKAGREWAMQFSWDNSAERMEQWLLAIAQKKRS